MAAQFAAIFFKRIYQKEYFLKKLYYFYDQIITAIVNS
jgi:hypothetical protein